jgi:tetratricopeptide (TPR) repeat protein
MEQDGQLTFEDDPLYIKQNRAHRLLEEGRFKEAILCFENILAENPHFPGVIDGSRAARFWLSKAGKVRRYGSAYDKARLLLKEWRDFEKFMVRNNLKHGRASASIQKHIFGDIIDSFTKAYNEGSVPDTDILVQIGDCFKKLGNYERAIGIYEHARSFGPEDPGLLARLADCCFSIDDTSKAKVLFREAFFIDPGQVELECIESPFIHSLFQKTVDLYPDQEAGLYWLPVVAEISGAFNVKREPKKGELDRLRESIDQLEIELGSNKKKRPFILPRLINHYFWLVDTLKIIGGSRKEIERALTRINELDPEVFALYMK